MCVKKRWTHKRLMKTMKIFDYGYVLAISEANSDVEALPFRVELYEGRHKDIDFYLGTLKRQEGWMDKIFKDIRHQSYNYLLRDGFLWKRPKRKNGVPLRVIDDAETKNQILKIKERYWWKGLYKDVEDFFGILH